MSSIDAKLKEKGGWDSDITISIRPDKKNPAIQFDCVRDKSQFTVEFKTDNDLQRFIIRLTESVLSNLDANL